MIRRSRERQEARFWAQIDQSGGPDACHPWTGYKSPWIHRVALLLTAGDPPPGRTQAMHACDNAPCCNPRHLSWGNSLENNQQMWARGRGRANGAPGVRNTNAKLDEVRVHAIRLAYPTTSATELSRQYGVTVENIYSVLAGKTWRSVEWTPPTADRVKRIPQEAIDRVAEKLESPDRRRGWQAEVAREFGISKSSVTSVIRRLDSR